MLDPDGDDVPAGDDDHMDDYDYDPMKQWQTQKIAPVYLPPPCACYLGHFAENVCTVAPPLDELLVLLPGQDGSQAINLPKAVQDLVIDETVLELAIWAGQMIALKVQHCKSRAGFHNDVALWMSSSAVKAAPKELIIKYASTYDKCLALIEHCGALVRAGPRLSC